MSGTLHQAKRYPSLEAGFSLVELMVAIVVLLVGIVAVAQLVPTSIDLNLRNRYDSSALIIGQRQLEQMVRQPLAVQQNAALPDYNFTDADGQACYLGALPVPATAPPNQPPPGPVQTGCAVTGGLIDFTQPCAVAGYFKTVSVGDYTYSVRWNVITVYGNDKGTIRPVMKQITLAGMGTGPRPLPPTTLSLMVGPEPK